MEEKYFQSFWSVIPTLLLEDEEIPLRAKKLYGLLSNLCRKEGYCWASNKFLSEQTEIPIGTLRKYLKILDKKGWIKSEVIKEEGNERKIYLKLPNFEIKESGGMSKNGHRGMSTITNNREQTYAHASEQKIPNNNIENNNIKNITIIAEQGSASSEGKEINELIDKFKSVNPTYERLFGNKTQRAALERLVKKFGKEKVNKMIEFLPKIFGKPYAPVITTPYQLEQRLGDLFAYIKKEKSKGPKLIEI